MNRASPTVIRSALAAFVGWATRSAAHRGGALRFAQPTLLAVLCTLATPALAERYRVDLIVFGDRTGAAGEAALAPQPPNLSNALQPYETAQLRATGIEVLPDDQFGLTEAWSRLRNSRNHQPLLRLAWLQQDPPAERGVSIRLRHGTPFSELTPAGMGTVYPVDGTVALLVGRFLHVDVDLAYTQVDGADLRSYRLRERRRLRRDELHHLDSPRLGVLVRAQRAVAKGETQASPKSSTKTPAKPAAKPKKR